MSSSWISGAGEPTDYYILVLGGWWFNNCFAAHLTGDFKGNGLKWKCSGSVWHGDIKAATMSVTRSSV